MEFGSSTVVLATGTNPSADQSVNSLLNNFDMSSTSGASSSGNIILAFATSGNGVGTDAIGGASDAVLAWAGNGTASVGSGALSTDSGGEIGITSMQFAYQQAVGASTLNFTFTGKKDGATVGTLVLVAPTHNSAISIDLTSPTTGSFSDIDEIVITPATEIFGGFSIDEMIVTSAVSNTAPVIGGTTAGQSVNDNSTISPFSSITTTDTDGDNLSATITLDNNAKGILTGTGLSGTGPYTIASTTPADLQTKLRALSFNPTDNRTSTTETTTFTVVVNDGTVDDTDNTTTVISSAVAPAVSSVSVPTNATYVTGQNLDFTISFDEEVTVNTTGGIPQIAITIGATIRQATYISGSGTNALVFRHTVLSGDLDTDGIAVGSLATNGSTLKDSGGKDANLTLNNIGSTTGVLVDAVAPTVTSVATPSGGTYVAGQDLNFFVFYSENITVNTTGGIPQIAISIGSDTRQAAYVSGSGTNTLFFRYTIQTGDLDTDGIAVTTLTANGGTLKDAANNDANTTLNNIADTSSVLVDAAAPTVTSVATPSGGTYIAGQDLNFFVFYNENITVNTTGGTPQIAISIGSDTRQAVYVSGSGTSTLLFKYTVQTGDLDTDGIAVTTLTANGGTLKDAVNNDANTTLNNIANTSAVLVDAVAPTISSVSIPNNAAKVGDAITVTITANEAGLLLNTGLINGTTVSGLTDNGGGNYTATYTVVEGNTDRAAGDDIPVNFILTDAAGNNSSAFTTAISQNADAIDANSPSITNVSIPNNATKVGDAITVTITANEAGLLLNTGLINGTTVSGLTDNGGGNYTATYTVVEGNTDRAAGDDIPVNFILTDAAGNNSSAFTTAISQNADAIDANSPSVSNVSVPSDATYTTGQNLDFTVNFNENTNVNTTGGTPQIAITIGTTTRQAVYLSGSGTSALVFRYTVQSGDLDTDGIVVGTLALNGGTLKDTATNDANLTLNSVGSTTAVLVGSQNFTWTGATNNDWHTASNWDLNSVPSTSADIVIPSGLTNYPTASSAVTFNSLTINNGASFIPQSTVTGTITYKRNLPTTNWYLVSPPVAGETLEDIIANHTLASGTGGNLGLAPYSNITGPAWLYVQSGNTGTVTNGTGVSIKLATPGEVSISGTANTSNIAKAISTGSRTNYNLVGNPYTSYINSASFTAANSSILTSETIWLWNGTQYTTRNAVNPIEIAPGQGFFVEAAASNNIIFAFSNQSHQNSDTFMRQEPIPLIELFVNNNDIKRSTQVFYVSGKTTGYDRSYDSKMFGEDTSGLAIFTELLTNNQGKKLAIQTLPDNDYENMVVPVGLRALSGEEVTFSINTKNIPTSIKVYLEDRINNVFTNLSEENYTITLNKDSNSIGQFYLHTSSKNLEAPTIIPSLDNVSIYNSSNNEITIVGLQAKANVSVYSVLGKEVLNKNITSNGVSNITLPKISTGIYIVKLNSDLGEISKKIILK
ncbi:T9SS type A sorting domain-containing protein [Tenacibaculum singaporense]|nr:T9SS type A sorting domain-containing protein [Tenacibaculum singaporense]